jgi:tRNA/rRNA methyltransferase
MKFAVILVNPKNPENVGLIARNMKNTGFEELRLVGLTGVDQKSYVTAVHARAILERARFYPGVSEATADLDIVFASTAKERKNFPSVSLKDAVEEMFQFPALAKVGLLFGNERTGLTSEELRSSNFRFMIPQAARQPSYNLASAVLLTLFHIFTYDNFKDVDTAKEKPLSRSEQEDFIRLILRKLEQKNFIHGTNKRHMTEMIYDLFGRFTLTAKDRKLLLALFSKAAGKSPMR